HQAGLFFWASRWGQPQQQMQDAKRNYVQMTSDKNVYSPGDKATLSFPTAGQGMALFTVEQAGSVLWRDWKVAGDSVLTFSFDVTERMVPNCYAVVSLIQPHNQNTNDLPMRLYGVKPLRVEDLSTRLPLTLTAPSELQPKQTFKVAVSSKSSKRASYTIAVVDEGLLSLTDFETPSPWDHYFQKLRLGVTTTDNYEQVLGVLFPDVDKYFSIGGGFGAARKRRLEPTKVRRFVPAVLFRGPIAIDPGQTVTTSFTMPNYIGAVRIMVVGAGGHSYTSIERRVPVRQPLMVLPTVPRTARPGDQFNIPVTVFVMDSAVDTVSLSLATSSNLNIKGETERRLVFEKPGQRDAAFAVQTGTMVGADTVKVAATAAKFSADYTVHLPINSANPFITEVAETTVVKGDTVAVTPKPFGLAGTNAARLAFSRLPDIQLEKRYKYLLRYPYGCLEQTISSALPQLYLFGLVDLAGHEKKAAVDHINAVIARLSKYRLSQGFSFWPPSAWHRGVYSNWGTSYAGHFMIEAREMGYHVPPALYDHWLKDAQRRATEVNRKNHRYQTYRLYLLALAGKADIGAMNLVRENYLPELDPLSQNFLAAAYDIAGQNDAAEAVKGAAIPTVTSYREMEGTYGSALRDMAFITYLNLKMGDLKTASVLLRNLTKAFGADNWYSTQETAVAILALGTYYQSVPITGGAVPFSVTIGGKTKEYRLTGYQQLIDVSDQWGKPITISTTHTNPLFVTLFTEGIPLEYQVETAYHGLALQRNFYDEEGRSITVDNRQQGKAFWVVYRVKSQYSQPLQELALSSIFPAGWEIINTRLTGETLPAWVRKTGAGTGDYMDIRDDRVNWFFDLPAGDESVFAVKINPTFKGTFVLPPISVEAMYSPEFYARIQGGEVEVH
ncbi:MAG: hypothetical protein GF344_05030, partial [Chitinivibrionales bacterium]|nr:hypothetical protein [Chitinivibrionales bacterium]